MYTYSSDDHSGSAATIADIAAAHGLQAETAQELEDAFEEVGGYVTVYDADGALVAHVNQ